MTNNSGLYEFGKQRQQPMPFEEAIQYLVKGYAVFEDDDPKDFYVACLDSYLKEIFIKHDTFCFVDSFCPYVKGDRIPNKDKKWRVAPVDYIAYLKKIAKGILTPEKAIELINHGLVVLRYGFYDPMTGNITSSIMLQRLKRETDDKSNQKHFGYKYTDLFIEQCSFSFREAEVVTLDNLNACFAKAHNVIQPSKGW